MNEEFTRASANRIRVMLRGAEPEPGQFALYNFSSWGEFFGVLNDGIRCERAVAAPSGTADATRGAYGVVRWRSRGRSRR